MRDRDLYRQKKQAQLDKLSAEVASLKARASIASAEIQLKLNEQIRAFESQCEANQQKLTELTSAGEDAWESLKTGVESAWTSLKTGVSDAVAQFK